MVSARKGVCTETKTLKAQFVNLDITARSSEFMSRYLLVIQFQHICTCMLHACVRAGLCAHISYTHLNTYTHERMHAHTYTHTYAYTYMHIHVYTCIHFTHTYACIYIYVYMHVYMYVQASECKSQGQDVAEQYCAGASSIVGETVKVIRRVKYFSICDVCFSENRNPLSGLSARSDVKCVFFSKARN